jgi:hypothetical protein
VRMEAKLAQLTKGQKSVCCFLHIDGYVRSYGYMSLRSPLPPYSAGPIHFIGAREAMNSYDTCRTVEIQTVIVEVPARKRAN